jgi:mono/diheme cytochrome c family protein
MDVFSRQAQEVGLTQTQTEGKRLFAHYCATCHGETGRGDGQNAYNLDPKPPDFQTALRSHPASYWEQVIVGGSAAVGRSPLCPPWSRTLGPGNIDSLVAYLNVLAKPVTAVPAEGPAKER